MNGHQLATASNGETGTPLILGVFFFVHLLRQPSLRV